MELASGVYSLRQWMGGHVHAYLIDHAGELILIDTLFDTDAHRVVDSIRRLGRRVTDLKHILITHGHRSHLGGLAALKDMSGATVYAHQWEVDIIARDRKAQACSFIPGRPVRDYWPTYPLQLGLALGLGPHPPCSVDQTLAPGDRIGPLTTVDASGHTPGHLGFFWPERNILFAGDTIATWPRFDAGWKAFNLSLKQHGQTLRRFAEIEPDIIAIGHGEPIASYAADRVRELIDRGPE